MNKGFIGYLVVFVLLIAAALVFSSFDQITPNVAQAQAEMAVGTPAVQAITKGASWLVKLLIGGTVAGVAAAVYAEARKAYKAWQRNSRVKRWQSGPNARWQGQPQTPKLRREDLMLLALSGKLPADNLRVSPKLGQMRVSDEDNDELEFS